VEKYIALFHQLSSDTSIRIDFESEFEETAVYEILKLEEYKVYQFIDHDFLYNMKTSELDEKKIKYTKLEREKKTWFGIGRKTVFDILIHPGNEFYYPYQYGHYFYLFTKAEIQENHFQEWLNENFPKRFADFDELVGYGKTNELKLLNPDDYVLITNHDYQKEFGVAASGKIIDKLTERLNEAFNTEMEPFIITSK
jgi:hypothetical protein